MTIKIKICGITNFNDLQCVIDNQADYIGFILYNKSPRYIPPIKLVKLTTNIPSAIKKVGVFVNETINNIHTIAKQCSLDIIQLHGNENEQFCQKLAIDYPVWKALPLRNEKELQICKTFSADKILVDAITPEARGGTGNTCNWQLVKKLSIYRSTILAGGLTPTNITQAIRQTSPFAVDVSSGIELSQGIKDHNKIKKFINNIKNRE